MSQKPFPLHSSLEPWKEQEVETSPQNFYCIMSNGTVFGSSYPDGEPYQVLIGEQRVIKGWEEGLMLLKNKSKAVFFVPSSLAYGTEGLEGQVPPNTELIFYIEVTDVR